MFYLIIEKYSIKISIIIDKECVIKIEYEFES